jgi:hypothetical protein
MELERAGEIEVQDSERYLDLLTDTPTRHPRSLFPMAGGASAPSHSVVGSRYKEEGLGAEQPSADEEEEDPTVIAIEARERQAERKKRLDENLERYEVESRALRVPGSSAPPEGPTPPPKGGISSDSEAESRRPRRLSRRTFGFGGRRRPSTKRYESKSDTDITSTGPRSGDKPWFAYASDRPASADPSGPPPPGARGNKLGNRGQHGAGAGASNGGGGGGMGFTPPKRERKLSAGGVAAAIVKGWKAL